MQLFGKSVKDFTAEDIQRLKNNEIPETKILEYKRELKIDTDKDKKEFLYDIASFANTEGGIIIFGIEEKKDDKGQNTGIPSEIIGIENQNIDKLYQKIEDFTRDGIEPQLAFSAIKNIDVEGKTILILGIPKLVGLPYMVIFNTTNKFYKRKNTGKYLIDVFELNQIFMNAMTIKERANQFREKRVVEVRESKQAMNLDLNGSYFLHVIPLNNLGDSIIDISNDETILNFKNTSNPLFWNCRQARFNLEGFMIFSLHNDTNKIYKYMQLFRDGSIEFYTTKFFIKETKEIAVDDFEKNSIEGIEKAFKVLQKQNIEPPYAVFISFFDLINAKIRIQQNSCSPTDIIRDPKILFPAVIFHDLNYDISKAMKSTFDTLWQAANEQKSPL